MEPLTPRQAEVLDFIQRFMAEHAYSPIYREIGAALGIRTPNGVACHLKAMQKKGWITILPGCARGILLVDRLAEVEIVAAAVALVESRGSKALRESSGASSCYERLYLAVKKHRKLREVYP